MPIQHALELFEPDRRPVEVDAGHGYVDLLGPADTAGGTAAQRLMMSRALPRIYERFWRPLGVRLIMGVGGPGTDEEHELALAMLSISAGDRVLDVACGPGNFTRDFGLATGDGVVVGLDASGTMLGVAVRGTESDNIAYVRGDACDLPFRADSFDAVCCFAALYLIEDPVRALGEIVRVLAPGGRLALMSTCIRRPLPMPLTNTVVQGLSGVRIFDRDELTRALAKQGVTEVEQRVAGLAQFVSGRKPSASGPVVP
ncbi:MAG TPA: methyltransferase domain-containing protein [Solirubrobacterales bacterium]|nr:methyltransferase domain-containing protein [Solirubrobacterales bacterium]